MVKYNHSIRAIVLLIFVISRIKARLENSRSCADIDGEDGDYTITIGSSTIAVYCYDMNSKEPKTYITLENDQTFSTYYVRREAKSWTSPPTTTIETRFSKLRFDPLTMKVHTGDYTFAETSGYYIHNCGQGGCIGKTAFVPVGVAKGCEDRYSQKGTSKIDLRGTPLALATEWSHSGWKSGGSSSFSFSNQVVDIQGGGFCGWSAPTPVTDNEEWVGRGGWFICLCLTGSDDCNTPCEVDNHLSTGPVIVEIEKYQSCADIDGEDGDYILTIESSPVDVYCYDMNSEEPKTYITLSNDQTFSTYYVHRLASSQTTPPTTTIETRFSKLRFDPLTMKVYTGDYTFAETSGYYNHNCVHGGCIGTTAYVPVGVAKDCEDTYSKKGTAKIDLTGTPLSLATEWGNYGLISGGSSYFSSNNQVVDIQGGGYCGWSAPTPVFYDQDLVGKGGWFLCLCLTGSDNCSKECEIDSTLPTGPINVEKEHYSCADIDSIDDGVYNIIIGSSTAEVYCYDMNSEEPKTYITLANDQTFSTYYVQREAKSWTSPPTTTIETRFSKLRFDPLTMKVHTGDYTFAETSGYYYRNCEQSSGCIGSTAYVPVGVAKDCEGERSQRGKAIIDLRGTPFSIATEWSYWGYLSGGSYSLSFNNQVADIRGGGICGWSGPTPVAGNQTWVGKGGWFLCLCLTESDECSDECVVDTRLPMGPVVNEKKKYHHSNSHPTIIPSSNSKEESEVSREKILSCADIDGEDGNYTITIGASSVDVYCYDMNSKEPKTYISLSNDQTFSTYYVQREASSQTTPPTTTIETKFSKLRFDPLTMKVYTGDYTFAETSGYYSHNCGSGGCIGTTAYVPVGVAKDCEAPNSKQGTAKIDLTGTPLSLATDWSNSGYISGGSFSFSSENQVVDIQGGGYCGWSAPTPIANNEGWVGKGGWFLCLCLTGSDECSIACEIDNNLPVGPISVEKEHYSCADIDSIDDGVYKIKIGSSKNVDVYCYDMNSKEPKTYITLDNDQTYSTYFVQSGANSLSDATSTSIETKFSKLRFDPITLKVFTGDYTFADTSGYSEQYCEHGGCIGTAAFVPVGVAKDCEAPYSQQGKAKIDLTGTPFSVATEWKLGGFQTGGSSSFSSDNQVVDIQGGGSCGWSAPAPVAGNEGWVGKGGWFLCLCLTGSEECHAPCELLPLGPIKYL